MACTRGARGAGYNPRMSESTLDALLPAPLKRLLGRTLEEALNRALALDADSRGALAALDGRSVCVRVQQPPLALRLHVQDGRLCVGPAAAAELEVKLRPASLAAAALQGDGALPPGAVNLSGDADLARRLEKLARDYQPDLEAAFAARFGAVLGVPLARALLGALAQARTFAMQGLEDGAAWLRDEARLTPAREEIADFLDEVDHVRERSERLAARLEALRARLHGARR